MTACELVVRCDDNLTVLIDVYEVIVRQTVATVNLGEDLLYEYIPVNLSVEGFAGESILEGVDEAERLLFRNYDILNPLNLEVAYIDNLGVHGIHELYADYRGLVDGSLVGLCTFGCVYICRNQVVSVNAGELLLVGVVGSQLEGLGRNVKFENETVVLQG